MSFRRRIGKKSRAATRRTEPRAATTRDAKGRVHLVLHGKRADVGAYVTLSAPLFEHDWQNEVATSAANSSFRSLREGLDLEHVAELTEEAMQATSKLAENFLARAANGVVACTAGCDHCCHQSVGVTMPEALTIARHVVRTRTSVELDALRNRLARSRAATFALSADERYSPDHPCPFLEQSRCSIYDARPLSCRGMNSLDAAACADNLHEPAAHAKFLETGVGAPSFLEPIRAFHAVSAGLQLALAELFDLDMRPLDLTAALHELLSGTSPITEDWLRGNAPLAHARGGDGSEHARMRELSGQRRSRDPSSD